MRLLLSLLLISLAQLILSAEAKAQTCPVLSIDCPTYLSGIDKSVKISLSIKGGETGLNPKYIWKISAGKIISGQGTSTIIIDTSETSGQGITATVEIDGLTPGCDRVISCTVGSLIVDPPPLSHKFDEYGEIRWGNERERLSSLGHQLQNNPSESAYILIYGPRRVGQYLQRIRKFLVKKYDIDPERIGLINGGYNRKTKVELWIAPVGAEPPKPDPNF